MKPFLVVAVCLYKARACLDGSVGQCKHVFPLTSSILVPISTPVEGKRPERSQIRWISLESMPPSAVRRAPESDFPDVPPPTPLIVNAKTQP